MCGRLTLTVMPDEMRRVFGYEDMPNFPPRHNIAPTQPIGIVLMEQQRRRFRLVRWGFIPGWTRDPAAMSLLINARAETAGEKPTFRAAYRRRRCLVPASGFYEWRRNGKEKQPFLIRRKDGGMLALGGLYETYMSKDGSEIDTAAILTTGPNRLMAMIHDRMPVIIGPGDFERWLAGEDTPPEEVAALTGPAADDLLEAVPVSGRVNSVANDDAALLAPIGEPLTIDGDGPAALPPEAPRQARLFD